MQTFILLALYEVIFAVAVLILFSASASSVYMVLYNISLLLLLLLLLLSNLLCAVAVNSKDYGNVYITAAILFVCGL